MEKFVHKYLTSHYYVSTSDAGNDGIYSFDDIRKWKIPINNNPFIKELVKLFYIDEVTLKANVESWARTLKPDVNLTFYWFELESLLPLSIKIATKTLGLDLVPVQPMSAPSGILMSFDEPNRDGRIYPREGLEETIQELMTNQQHYMLGEFDHPDAPMAMGLTLGVSSRKSRESEEIERQSWFNKNKFGDTK